jgi:hypothetical protein
MEPVLLPAQPPPADGRFPIEANPVPKAVRLANQIDRFKYWEDYYAEHDETPAQLREKIDPVLRELDRMAKPAEADRLKYEAERDKKTHEVEAPIKGYLKNRGSRAEPWMYQTLEAILNERIKYWNDFFQTHRETPGEVFMKVSMRDKKKTLDIEALLRSYLIKNPQSSEPWMYEMLAATIEDRHGPPQEIRTYLGYAAFRATQKGVPTLILSAASMLVRAGIFDKVGPPGHETTAGELIDGLIKKVPHRFEPLSLSVDLANLTKDPKRMADTMDGVLSLGWPGWDEPARKEATRHVENMARTLREDGRSEEADTLLARFRESKTRDLYIALRWEGRDDIDLIVDESLGATCQLDKNPRSILGGAIVTNGYGRHPEEVYVCPRAFDGKYTIRVDPVFQPDNPAKEATLEVITHEGTPVEKVQTFKIDLTKPQPVVIELKGGRRKEAMPFVAPPRKEPLIVPVDVNKAQNAPPKPK